MRTVLYRDHTTDEVIRIVDVEVPPGSRRSQVEGFDEEVWYLPPENRGSLRDDPTRRPEYEAAISEIRGVFANFYPLTQAQWWEVLEGERNPVKVLERWSRAAEVFREAMTDTYLRSQGYEVFELLSNLVRLSPAELPRPFRSQKLPADTVRELVDRFRHGPLTVLTIANCSTDHD